MGMWVIRWLFERSSQLSRRTAYARSICEGSAVHAGELSICIGRIFIAGVGGAYALAVLAIGALRESVSLSTRSHRGGDAAQETDEQV
jgi:hypothetical protein